MDTVRYFVGCLLIIGLPPALAWWLVIHPFVGFWRRVGVRRSLTLGIALALLSMLPLYVMRDAILMVDLGTSWITIGIAAALAAPAISIALKRRKHLTMKILAGVPQLEPGGKGGALLTEGPYSRTRNPRYVEMILGVFAYAAFSNYLGAYLVAGGTLPVLHLIVILEERELRDRFGEEYEVYFAQVPRYIPRWGRSGKEPAAL